MSIYETLKRDHDKIRSLMAKVGYTSQSTVEEREELLTELKNLVLAHEKAEEAVFYSQIEPDDDVHADALEAYEEHKLTEDILASLEELEPSDQVWSARFEVLKENLERHFEIEESELFQKAQRIVSNEDADDMSADFIRLKDDITTELNLQ